MIKDDGDSSSSSGSSENENSIVGLVVLIIFIYYIISPIYLLIGKKKMKKDLKSYGITDIEKFKKDLYDFYVEIQTAFSKKDIDSVKHLLSDGLYNPYKTQILTMTTKNEQNIMSDFKYVNAKIPNESSTRCEYCGSEIIKDSTKIVLQRKRKLRQR